MTQSAIEAQNKETVKRYWDTIWNERRSEILDEVLTPDVVYHGTSMSANGIEEYKELYRKFATALHDSRLTIEDVIAEGDKVVTRVSMRCLHGGEFAGIPATGRELTVDAITVHRLVDGRIAEEWEISDELGMMEQLGMELSPAAATLPA